MTVDLIYLSGSRRPGYEYRCGDIVRVCIIGDGVETVDLPIVLVERWPHATRLWLGAGRGVTVRGGWIDDPSTSGGPWALRAEE